MGIGVIRLKDGKGKQMRIRDLLPPILLLTVCLKSRDHGRVRFVRLAHRICNVTSVELGGDP